MRRGVLVVAALIASGLANLAHAFGLLPCVVVSAPVHLFLGLACPSMALLVEIE